MNFFQHCITEKKSASVFFFQVRRIQQENPEYQSRSSYEALEEVKNRVDFPAALERAREMYVVHPGLSERDLVVLTFLKLERERDVAAATAAAEEEN